MAVVYARIDYARDDQLTAERRNPTDRLARRQRPGKARTVRKSDAAEASREHLRNALDQLERHIRESREEDHTGACISLLKLCGNSRALAEGRRLHAQISKNGTGFLPLQHRTLIANLVIQMYGKCRSVDEAQRAFESIEERDRDLFSWNLMIAAFAENGLLVKAQETFARMPEKDVVARTAMIVAHANLGRLEDAKSVFDNMPERDVVAWSAMITAFTQRGHCVEALHTYRIMDLEGVKANDATYMSTLDACAGMTAINEGRIVHANILETGYDSRLRVSTALVNMYGKSGSLESAKEVFDGMSSRNSFTWTAIVSANAQNGQYEEAVVLFQKMELEGFKPDGISFISLLYACSHGGFLDTGKQYFASMKADYGVTPVHSHLECVMDLLGRAGKLEEAEKMIQRIPPSGHVVAFRTLLAACKIHGDVERGARAAEKLFAIDSENPSPYLLLMNIYAAAGLWDLARKVRKALKDKGLRKEAGCSSIVVKNKVHHFTSGGGGNHPLKEEIYAEVSRLESEMRNRFGYKPDTSSVIFDVGEEEKEKIVRFHSEKLAIAFGIISSPGGSSLRIVKNLRVCVDCHSATKLISVITGRSILVRDGNRFHQVKDGACSCQDYW